jgi:Lanthionine synthetase C-like protein
VLFDPASHEPLTDRTWSVSRAQEAIRAIAEDAEAAYDPDGLWPAHPRDLEGGPLPAVASLYLGASGVIGALDELARAGVVAPRRDWAPIAAGLHERYLALPDFPENTGGGTVPSIWMGEAGILLVAHRLAPQRAQEDRLVECVRANAANPTWELMWGSPGTMLAARAMHDRTGDARWAQAWRESADRLWDAWGDPVWVQDLYGSRARYVGPAHGFAGNVLALASGPWLDDGRPAELDRRVAAVVLATAQREGEFAQWPPTLDPPRRPGQPIRTQWCHGAPGIVASLARVGVGDAAFGEVLLAGGELTWRAGPLAKGPGLCHGTAGNGYALLKLFERTGDEAWLARARAFAMHAAEQVERERAAHGRGRFSLWTGDVGVALYLESCLAATADVPTLDRL